MVGRGCSGCALSVGIIVGTFVIIVSGMFDASDKDGESVVFKRIVGSTVGISVLVSVLPTPLSTPAESMPDSLPLSPEFEKTTAPAIKPLSKATKHIIKATR